METSYSLKNVSADETSFHTFQLVENMKLVTFRIIHKPLSGVPLSTVKHLKNRDLKMRASRTVLPNNYSSYTDVIMSVH